MTRYCYIALSLIAIVIAAITVNTFGMADGATIVASLAIACVIPWLVGRRCSWWSPACTIVLVAVGLILVANALCNIYCTTLEVNATFEKPYLWNDAGGYYKWALHHYDGSCKEPKTAFIGYPLIVCGLFYLFGANIIWPVALNVMLTLFAVIMTSSLAVMITHNRTNVKATTIAALAMGLTSLHGFFLFHSGEVLKEPTMYIAMILVAMTFINILQVPESRKNSIKWIFLFAVACIIIAAVRARFINFVAIGIAIIAFTKWRSLWRSIMAMGVITFALWVFGMILSPSHSVHNQISIVSGGVAMSKAFGDVDGIQLEYYKLLNGYFRLEIWKKLLLLPITTGTQYMIPLPWTIESLASILAHVRIGWYLSGGLALFYYGFLSWRKECSLGLIAWWPAICFVAIAYICGGTVSRYTLSFQPVFISIAVYVIALVMSGRYRTLLRNFAIGYSIMLVFALSAAAFITFMFYIAPDQFTKSPSQALEDFYVLYLRLAFYGSTQSLFCLMRSTRRVIASSSGMFFSMHSLFLYRLILPRAAPT